VNKPEIEIRKLLPSEALAYRRIRLEALQLCPEAFGSTFETENAQPLEHFAERVTNSTVFAAYRNSELVGMAGFARRQGLKEAHKGFLWGMYVRSDERNKGIGKRLIEAVIECARQQVELIQLTVVSGNQVARRLYASLGFIEYGIERNSLKQGGLYYHEILMARELQPPPNASGKNV
jgi:GNAT superfamily N-acetyltransferase